jgi:hypothetical protein
MEMRNWKWYYNIPNFGSFTKKNQYSIPSGFCTIRYIWGHSPNNHPYGLFTSSGVEEHAYNFGPPHIEV